LKNSDDYSGETFSWIRYIPEAKKQRSSLPREWSPAFFGKNFI